MDAEQKLLGQRVRKERKRRRLTIEELADLAEVTKNTVGNFERGRTYPQKSNLVQILRALDIPLDGHDDAAPARPSVENGGWSSDVRVALNVIGLYLESFPPGDLRDEHLDTLVKRAVTRTL